MKSPSLLILSVALLGTPFFMGQAATQGGGGCGCSDTNATGISANPIDQIANNAAAGGSGDATSPTAPASDVCTADDISGSVQTSGWSQAIASDFGRPVDGECKNVCSSDSTHTPWTLHIHLSGTFFSEDKDYSFNFLKDEWKDKVISLEATRDAADPEGCPVREEKPCWRTCSGECLPFETPVKDGDTLTKEGEAVLTSYLNDMCQIGLTVADFSSGDFNSKLKAALDKSSLKDFVQCAEGLLLTGTQVIPWVESVLNEGLLTDEKGVAYTPDQVYRCVKKQLFDNASKAEPPPTAAAPAAAPSP